MGVNSFTSDQDNWITISAELYKESRVYRYMDAVREIERTNEILRNAPADVGGTVAFYKSMVDAESVYSQWQELYKFANGIHYEVAELIDIPFVQKLQPIVEDLYNLNPKDFRTKKDFLFIPRGSSLEDVLIDMVENEELKKSYQTMIEDLDYDEIDSSLLETMEIADYWAQQFEEAAQIRVIAKQYTDLYEEGWKELTADEKLVILNNYALEIGEVLDEKRWYEFWGHKPIVVSVDWDVNDPNYNIKDNENEDEVAGYSAPLSRNGCIYINYEAKENESLYDFSFLLDIVTHETRHLYQGQAKLDMEKFGLPNIIGNEWNFVIKTEDDYWLRKWEVDARAFAAITQAN